METLCRAYWYPLYAYIRRKGLSPADAQDVTQEFFCRLIGKNYLESVDRSRGSFRSFLLASVNHLLANEWDKARALKRGGGRQILSLDAEEAEGRYVQEPAAHDSPEKAFDRRWALTLLDRALAILRVGGRQAFAANVGIERIPISLAERFQSIRCIRRKAIPRGSDNAPMRRLKRRRT